jgi:hypothetical protein
VRCTALSQATAALELAVAADAPVSADNTAEALACLRLLARVVPFVAGDASLGRGASAAGPDTNADADAALVELAAYLAGGPLPAPRADEWQSRQEAADAAAAVLEAEARLSGGAPVDADDVAATAAAAMDLMRSDYAAPPPDDTLTAAAAASAAQDAPQSSSAEPQPEPVGAPAEVHTVAMEDVSLDAPPSPAAAPTPQAADAPAMPATPAPTSPRVQTAPPPPPPLWVRISCAVADASLRVGITLAPRASAWAPPLAPGSASVPSDADCAGARVDALRALAALAAAEALYVPFSPAQPAGGDASETAAAPPRCGASFLAAFSGRGVGAGALPRGTLRRLFGSVLNGASCAPGLVAASPEGGALVRACMRALLLMVCVAEEDVPSAAAAAAAPDAAAEDDDDADAPALFARMALPQAACLHASVAAVLASAASTAVATAEWADVFAGGSGDAAVSAVPSAGAALSRAPPPGASEGVALALAAVERSPAFCDVAAGRTGGGGWHLAGPVLTLMLVLRDEPSAAGLLRAASFLLLNLGSRRAFGVALNEPLRIADAPLASAVGLGPPFPPGATRGDALLAALAALLAYPLSRGTPIGRERPLYAPLLALLLNAAPCLKGITPPGAGAAMHLLAALAQPCVLLQDAAGAPLLRSVLDALADVLTHQADANPALLGALLRHGALLADLQTLTLLPETTDMLAQQQQQQVSPPGAPAAPDTGAALEPPAPLGSAELSVGTAALFGGLHLVAPEHAAPPFRADAAWLDGVRATWPLAELAAVAAAVAPVYGPWREGHPSASVYEEADFLRSQPLAGLLPPPRPRAPRTYARTPGVAAWQARHAAGLALLAEPGACDAPRVRRLRVALR